MVTSDQTLGELRPLEEALGYRNRHIVDRFVERHAVPREEAEDLFVETLRWLWLCRRAERDPAAPELFIDECMALLDEMWHTFVLFTREYTRYCETYLGGYVHHEPTTSEQKARAQLESERNQTASAPSASRASAPCTSTSTTGSARTRSPSGTRRTRSGTAPPANRTTQRIETRSYSNRGCGAAQP